MKEYNIQVPCIMYDIVTPCGHLYTKRLTDKLIDRFNTDKDFRNSLFCQSKTDNPQPEISYPRISAKVMNFWYASAIPNKLMTTIRILDTPEGRELDYFFTRNYKVELTPFGICNATKIEGIEIINSDSYSLCYFESLVLPKNI